MEKKTLIFIGKSQDGAIRICDISSITRKRNKTKIVDTFGNIFIWKNSLEFHKALFNNWLYYELDEKENDVK